MSDGGGGFLEHAGVALDEEDVEEEVQGEGPEVDESGEEAPVLHSPHFCQSRRYIA